MRIAIISDSHHAVDTVKKLLNHLRETGIKHLIHAGDFIGYKVESVFADFPDIQSWIARGNCDSRGSTLDYLNGLDHVVVSDLLRFSIDGVSFIVGHIPGSALNAYNKEPADIIIHGHTHLPRIESYQDALLLNPGSLMEGDGYMLLELPDLTVNRHFNF